MPWGVLLPALPGLSLQRGARPGSGMSNERSSHWRCHIQHFQGPQTRLTTFIIETRPLGILRILFGGVLLCDLERMQLRKQFLV